MAPFFVVLLNCLRSLCLLLAQKSGVRFMFFTISPKLLYQIRRPLSHFVEPKPLACSVYWFFNSPKSKILEERILLSQFQRKELDALYFFNFLIQFLTKTSGFWSNLLLLRRASLKWLVTVLKIFFRTVIQWWRRKNKSLLNFYAWVVFWAIEQVFWRALRVF